MTFTSEERREVAKRMREYDVLEFRESAIVPFLDFLGHGYVNWRAIIDELADLIDPTCRVVGTISQDWSDGSTVYEHELSCGHTCRTAWHNPPAYCDRCGARVVDE